MVDEVASFRQQHKHQAWAGPWAIAGCTAPSTAEAIERARQAQRAGADAIAVALPYFVPLRREEAYRFFQELAAACPDLPILHYQTPRSGTLLEVEDYLFLAEVLPTLIGSKQTGTDLTFFMELQRTTPQLVHLRVDALVPEMLVGARGCISAIATLNPDFILHLYQLCLEGRWQEALQEQFRINAFKRDLRPFIAEGYLDPVIDKALTDLSGFCQAGPPRQPFLPMPPEAQARLRSVLAKHPFLLWRAQPASKSTKE